MESLGKMQVTHESGIKKTGQIKIDAEIRAIFFCIFAPNWMSLRDPFFGSSSLATEWDQIVAEIIHTTFVFLKHPRGGAKVLRGRTQKFLNVDHLKTEKVFRDLKN